MYFRINLAQFYINFLRQEHQIDVLYVPFNAWHSQVSSWTPFHFSFIVPLTRNSKFQELSEKLILFIKVAYYRCSPVFGKCENAESRILTAANCTLLYLTTKYLSKAESTKNKLHALDCRHEYFSIHCCCIGFQYTL